MNKKELNNIAKQLAENLKGILNSDFIKIKKLLLDGIPVTPDRISNALNIPLENVKATLDNLNNIEFDEMGNVIGAGITLKPTPHHFKINGKNLYTWCAFDTLFFPVILKMKTEVESKCPATETSIKLTVSPERIEFLEPEEAAISIIIPSKSDACCGVRNSFCNEIYFFKSGNTAREYLKDKNNIFIMTVSDGYLLGQMFTEYLLK